MITRAVCMKTSPYDVYVGRKGRGEDGYFGNPFRAGAKCKHCGELHWDAYNTLDCFRLYFLDRLAREDAFKARVLELRGKRLGCFCTAEKYCHASIIADWVNDYFGDREASK